MSKMLIRFASAFVIIFILFYTLYMGPLQFILVLMVLAGLVADEMVRMAVKGGISFNNFERMVFVIVSTIGMLALTRSIVVYNVYSILYILIYGIFFLFFEQSNSFSKLGVMGFGYFYISMFYGSAVLIVKMGWEYAFWVMILVWAYDSFAYFIGSAYGKHKIFKSISPSKSLEGTIAGLVMSTFAGILIPFLVNTYSHHFLDFPMWQGIIIGATVGVASQVGDLFESKIKRNVGIKDSSSIIPGHGGIFDRIDSMFYALPSFFLIVQLFLRFKS